MMNSPVEAQTAEGAGSSAFNKEWASRRWRVGTLSMGISLLFLGLLIMASQWKGADVFETPEMELMLPWPHLRVLR
ncbi:hypothetical protein PaeBR_10995 [Paenibacillus sp. BR2-3]|uniref:hypothetical protein n=1 Tax=Paenibacillus sp. BR2-3 TaxID=3048494 RepID=UPI00397793A6